MVFMLHYEQFMQPPVPPAAHAGPKHLGPPTPGTLLQAHHKQPVSPGARVAGAHSTPVQTMPLLPEGARIPGCCYRCCCCCCCCSEARTAPTCAQHSAPTAQQECSAERCKQRLARASKC